MKGLYGVLILLFLQLNAFGQTGYLIKMDRLKSRMQQGGDTTYIINFWATWCAPCIKELPIFEKLQKRSRSQKLKILLISVDFRSSLDTAFLPFIKNRKIKNEVYLLDEADQQEYINAIDSTWYGSIPATLIKKNDTRKFFEQQFTYRGLLTEYRNIK